MSAGSADAGDSGGDVSVVRTAAWPGLPPIQRATARPSWPVADSGFGGRLSTWQNPAFTGTLSHAVLDGAPGGLVQGVLTTSAQPSPGLELPSLSLPVAAPDAPRPAPGEHGAGHPGDGTDLPPVQRAAVPLTVTRPSGPSVTPVPAPVHRPATLTRTTATAAPVQRRALPVVGGAGTGGSGTRPAASTTPTASTTSTTSAASTSSSPAPATGGTAPAGTRRRPLLGAPVTAPPPGSAPLTKTPAASLDSPAPPAPPASGTGAPAPVQRAAVRPGAGRGRGPGRVRVRVRGPEWRAPTASGAPRAPPVPAGRIPRSSGPSRPGGRRPVPPAPARHRRPYRAGTPKA
ncbi:hypothetical protein [Streptomyces sp. H-KF8]|uniref:hypothetical protein n=1 Tax=Streptomyces sp. H-KF8 TaxID=1727216 RepID=UPI00133158F3|nr:hypothetical protein [Streptomyces sp. H-KF8]